MQIIIQTGSLSITFTVRFTDLHSLSQRSTKQWRRISILPNSVESCWMILSTSKTLDIEDLNKEDLESLRKNNPFMYHSIPGKSYDYDDFHWYHIHNIIDNMHISLCSCIQVFAGPPFFIRALIIPTRMQCAKVKPLVELIHCKTPRHPRKQPKSLAVPESRSRLIWGWSNCFDGRVFGKWGHRCLE